MKKIILLQLITLLFVNLCFSQEETPIHPVFERSIDATIGYVPNPEFNALKLNLSIENIIFYKRVGFYTSFEKGLDSDYFSNIMGIHITVIKYFYVYLGIDIFTANGIIKNADKWAEGTRKEMGVGVYPYKNFLLTVGWSASVHWTFTVGYRFPVKRRLAE